MGGFLRVDGKRFRDELFIYPQNGKCEVVNHVDLEKYVAGLLNSEMSARWNLETLKAQAIAARTYALYQMEVASKDGKSFDMHATVKDQVYEGAHQERYRTIRAVQETRGQILTHGGKTIKAFYHSTCGGHTTTPERVWGVRAKYLTPVRCEFCHTSPRYRWAYRVGHSVLEMAFRMKGLVQKKLTDLKITQKSPSGRVLQVAYADGTERRTINGDRLREVVGYSNLRSTSFDVLKTGNTYVFDGGGAGHGVGLCQWGAKTMGDRGYKATAILKKYYPLAQVTKVY
jgi:stage II sporulation protein D